MKYEKDIKFEGYEFPLDEAEIDSILGELSAEDVEGIEKIVITNPLKNEDFKRFGRYNQNHKGQGIIYLFAHQKVDGEFIIETGHETLRFSLEEFKREAYKTVLKGIEIHRDANKSTNIALGKEDYIKVHLGGEGHIKLHRNEKFYVDSL